MANTIIQFDLIKHSENLFYADENNVYIFGPVNKYMLDELLNDSENYLALIGDKIGLTETNKPTKVTIEIFESHDDRVSWYDFKVLPNNFKVPLPQEVKQIEAEVFESESLKSTIYPEIKTVGDLLRVISPLSPDIAFGFLNQPMQKLEHRVSKPDGFESLVFQRAEEKTVLPSIKEKWSVGKVGGTIITNTPSGLPINTGRLGEEVFNYYGGALICESIWRKKDIALIAAAPDLLEACIKAEKHHQGYHSEIGSILREAIKKAIE